jgi:NADPH:quinone reductase-like Zn-dependent oxidoreductase
MRFLGHSILLPVFVLCNLFVTFEIHRVIAMTTMKRVDLIQVGGIKAGQNLISSNVDEPIPIDESEVLIDVKASAVNPVDWKQAEYGFYIPQVVNNDNPCALGCDVAGVVVGPTSSPLLGKRVLAYLGADKTNFAASRGAFVDKVLFPSDLVFEIPDGMSYSAAATLPVGGLTATLLMDGISSASQVDEFVIVYGSSSSVGFNAVQLAKAKGYRVIAIASGKNKESAMDLGAEFFVDYRTQDIKEAVSDIVKASPDTPLNGAMDCIGTADTYGICSELVGMFGNTPDGSPRIVSSVSPGGDGPDRVKQVPVNLGQSVETEPEFIQKTIPILLQLPKTQPPRIISGPIDAKTVEEGFQVSKGGVSGEKIIFEWTK